MQECDRSENYLIQKTSDQTPAQLGLQPITVEAAQAQSSGSAAKESVAAPAPGPGPSLNTSEAAAATAASLVTAGKILAIPACSCGDTVYSNSQCIHLLVGGQD